VAPGDLGHRDYFRIAANFRVGARAARGTGGRAGFYEGEVARAPVARRAAFTKLHIREKPVKPLVARVYVQSALVAV
jgi:hypothetical protein